MRPSARGCLIEFDPLTVKLLDLEPLRITDLTIPRPKLLKGSGDGDQGRDERENKNGSV